MKQYKSKFNESQRLMESSKKFFYTASKDNKDYIEYGTIKADDAYDAIYRVYFNESLYDQDEEVINDFKEIVHDNYTPGIYSYRHDYDGDLVAVGNNKINLYEYFLVEFII